MPLCNCRTARHRPVGTSSWSASRSCHGCHLLIFCSERESDVCTSPGDAQGAQYGASEQLDSAGLRGQAVCYEVRSTCVHHPSVSARSDVVDVLRRWGADRQPLPVQDGGPGRGTPRQHLPPSRVGGADRPKGRESRLARARSSGGKKRRDRGFEGRVDLA